MTPLKKKGLPDGIYEASYSFHEGDWHHCILIDGDGYSICTKDGSPILENDGYCWRRIEHLVEDKKIKVWRCLQQGVVAQDRLI